MSADPVMITTTGPAPEALVTEAEYAAREAARPPAGGGSSFGVSVTTEAALRSALPLGGRIHVNVVGELPLTVAEAVRLAAPGTVLSGLGKNTTALAIKCENPNRVSFYAMAKGVTFQDITLDSGFFNLHCVYSDCLNNVDGLTLDNVRVRNAVDGIKYVGHMAYPPMRGFTFRDSEVIAHKGYGMTLDCDLENPVIENFDIVGVGAQESFTALWIGQGILGGRIVNGRIKNSGYNGLEVFYAHTYPGKSQLSRDNPFGAGMMIRGIEIDGVKNIACSLAGIKRSVVSDIHVRNAGSGMEYIDEIIEQDGKPMFSDYNASSVTVAGIKGVGVTIHRLKRGRFSNHVVTDCGMYGAQIYDGADRINLHHSTFARCADRMLFCNGALGGTYTDNEFIKSPGDPATFGFYAFGGSHIFARNVLRGGLRTGLAQATVQVAPATNPQIAGEVFTDSSNFRIPN